MPAAAGGAAGGAAVGGDFAGPVLRIPHPTGDEIGLSMACCRRIPAAMIYGLFRHWYKVGLFVLSRCRIALGGRRRLECGEAGRRPRHRQRSTRFMAEIDSELAANVKVAKTKRMRFAFIAKGASDGRYVLAKTKVPPVLITAAKKKSGGTQVIQGACFGEDGKLVFEMAKEPATLEAALKKVIQRDAGISQHCICRQGTDPDLAESNAPEQPGAAGQPGALARSAAPLP